MPDVAVGVTKIKKLESRGFFITILRIHFNSNKISWVEGGLHHGPWGEWTPLVPCNQNYVI